MMQNSNAPALYYSLYLLFAILFALLTPWALLFALLFLFGQERKRAFIAVSLFLLTLAAVQHLCFFPKQSAEGDFRLLITSTKTPMQNFQKRRFYKGILQEVKGEKRCKLHTLLFSKEKLLCGQEYWVEGTLTKAGGRAYFLLPKKKCLPTGKRKKLFILREKSKEALTRYINKHYKERSANAFITGLTTGKLENHLLYAQLAHIGCAHLLAISGFHLGLLAALALFCVRPLFPYKIHALMVLILLLFYLLFIGTSASISRAFIFASLFLLSPLFEKRASLANTMGIALGLLLLLDPLMALEVGFQLSFLATGAIILLYPKIKALLCYEGRGNLFFSTFALTFSVHLALLPLMLLYFHNFSFHSLFYNLFFPSLTALTLLLFILGLAFPPLHLLNDILTRGYLQLAEGRIFYEKSFYTESPPSWLIALLFVALYFLQSEKMYKEG